MSITQQLEAEGIDTVMRLKFRTNIAQQQYTGIKRTFNFKGDDYDIFMERCSVIIRSQSQTNEKLALPMNEFGRYIGEVYVDGKPMTNLPQDRLELLKHAHTLYSN